MSEAVREWINRLREATVDTTERPTVLVPFELFEGEAIPPGTFELLSQTHVVLLGYFHVPDQTAPGQASMQFEERGEQVLDDLGDRFEEAGAVVDSLLCFTHKPATSIDRIAKQFGCEARLVLNQVAEVEDILLAVTPRLDVEQVIALVGAIFLAHSPTIHLLDVGEEVGASDIDRVRRTLVSIGFDDDKIRISDADATRSVRRITEVATEMDVVVTVQPRRDIESFILGERAERIAKAYVGPVLVIYEHATEVADASSTVED